MTYNPLKSRFGWWWRFVPWLWKINRAWMCNRHMTTPMGKCQECKKDVYPGPTGYVSNGNGLYWHPKCLTWWRWHIGGMR
jgi:hypothetical protein